MVEDDPTVIIIMVLIICLLIGGGLGFAYQKGYIGGDDDDDDVVDVVSNDACSEYTCPTGYTADSTANDTLCSSPTCTIADKDTCCNSDTMPTCLLFDCPTGKAPHTNANAITCSADPCTETECCSDDDASENTGCTPDPCLNGGVCTANASGSGHTCACVTGYSGDNCETPTQTPPPPPPPPPPVSGADVVCTEPANLAGYNVTNTELNVVNGFDVGVSCATGYEPTVSGQPPVATPCTTSGPYTVSGCEIIRAEAPCLRTAVTKGSNVIDGTKCGDFMILNHNEICDYNCNQGFMIQEQPRCDNAGGRPSSTNVGCIPDPNYQQEVSPAPAGNCSSRTLFSVQNGQLGTTCNPSTNPLGIPDGHSCNLTCDSGYFLNSGQPTCTNGVLSPPTITCAACTSLPNATPGTITCTDASDSIASACNNGWRGDTCGTAQPPNNYVITPDRCMSTTIATGATMVETGNFVSCAITRSGDFGVTDGTCYTVDSSVASCTYIPGTYGRSVTWTHGVGSPYCTPSTSCSPVQGTSIITSALNGSPDLDLDVYVTRMSSSVDGHITYRVFLDKNTSNIANLYAVYGDTASHPFIFPPSWQSPSNSINVLSEMADASTAAAAEGTSHELEFDSFISIGHEEAADTGALNSQHLYNDFLAWTPARAINSPNAQVYLIDPNDLPTGIDGKILLAQLTLPDDHHDVTLGMVLHGDLDSAPGFMDAYTYDNYITITIPSCSDSGECFANIGESCGKQNNNKNNNKNNKNKNNLLNMNNTHKNLLFVLLIIVIFFLFKDKM